MATAVEPTAPASQPAPSTPQITLRQPSTSTSAPTIPAPPLSWLTGPWNVTHSTLPMWKTARNVKITYTPIPSSGGTSGAHLNDLVTYQNIDASKTKVSEVRGVDKPLPLPVDAHAGAVPATNPPGEELASLRYTWRGKGWLVIASSTWEILGWGEEEGGNAWVVTYFQKTLFTPAGVDFYSRRGRLGASTVEGIKGALEKLGGEVGGLGGEVFEVVGDGERERV